MINIIGPAHRALLLLGCALALAACGRGDDAEEASQTTVQEAEEAEAGQERAQPGAMIAAIDALTPPAPMRSVALWRHPTIPFESRILAAHGAQGLSILSLTGETVARLSAPADVVAVAGDQVRVFALEDGGGSKLTRYDIHENGDALTPAGPSESPSPIAATTLLRTNIAALGPAILRDGALIRGDARVPLDAPATTMAASTANFGGVYRRGLVAMGGEDGLLRLYALETVAQRLGLDLPDQEGPTRGEAVVEDDENGREQ